MAARDGGLRLRFVRAPKTPTIEVPIHLDVNAADREREVERLLGIGAKLVETKTSAVGDVSETWTVMRDPEGNGFCVQGPDPRAGERPLLYNVTFACADPPRLAAFWASALGYVERPPDTDFLQKLLDAGLDPAELDSYASAVHPDGTLPRLLFQRRQKTPAADLPLRLDLDPIDVEAEVARLVSLGARTVHVTMHDANADRDLWTLMKDPEGNGFCVFGRTAARAVE